MIIKNKNFRLILKDKRKAPEYDSMHNYNYL